MLSAKIVLKLEMTISAATQYNPDGSIKGVTYTARSPVVKRASFEASTPEAAADMLITALWDGVSLSEHGLEKRAIVAMSRSVRRQLGKVQWE